MALSLPFWKVLAHLSIILNSLERCVKSSIGTKLCKIAIEYKTTAAAAATYPFLTSSFR